MAQNPMQRRTLREALTRQDAPVVLQGMIDIFVRQAYEYKTSNWRRYVTVDEVTNFREIENAIVYTDDVLDRIIEGEPYPEGRIVEDVARWRVHKYGKILKVTYEMMVNDDLRAIRNLAINYGRLAESGEPRLVGSLLDSLAVSDDLDGNPLTGALDETLIQRALNAFYERQTAGGRKLNVRPAYVIASGRWVDPLRTIFRPSTVYDFNPLAARVEVIEEPYLPASAVNSIFFVADPALMPGIEVDFLNVPFDARENYTNGPRVIPDSIQPLSALPGDVGLAGEGFRYDTLAYKVRHVYGGGIVDPLALMRVNLVS